MSLSLTGSGPSGCHVLGCDNPGRHPVDVVVLPSGRGRGLACEEHYRLIAAGAIAGFRAVAAVPYSGITTASEAEPPHQVRHTAFCSCRWRGIGRRVYQDAQDDLDGHLSATGHAARG